MYPSKETAQSSTDTLSGCTAVGPSLRRADADDPPLPHEDPEVCGKTRHLCPGSPSRGTISTPQKPSRRPHPPSCRALRSFSKADCHVRRGRRNDSRGLQGFRRPHFINSRARKASRRGRRNDSSALCNDSKALQTLCRGLDLLRRPLRVLQSPLDLLKRRLLVLRQARELLQSGRRRTVLRPRLLKRPLRVFQHGRRMSQRGEPLSPAQESALRYFAAILPAPYESRTRTPSLTSLSRTRCNEERSGP